MLCSGCHSFLGNPCPCCRTVSRLKFLLENSRLPPSVELKVLSALRQAVGEVSDVIEEHGVFKPQKRESSPKVEAKEESAGSKGLDKEDKEEPARKKEREARKEERKKRKALSGAQAGVEETPGGLPGVEETPSPGKTAEIGEEGKIPKKERETRGEEAEGDRPRKSKEERLQTKVDRYVSDNPDTFGLGQITLRGSAARHFRENDVRRSERPPEPEGPPPIRRQPRERSRSKKQKKKSKGKAHRQRGRDFWRDRRQG